MFNIGTGEMIMIAVVALLVLGPQRLPELARGIGKFIREFRRQTDDVRNVVEREFYRMDNEIMNPASQIQASPDAVPAASSLPEGAQAETPHAPVDEPAPQQGELALQGQAPALEQPAPEHAPLDESEPGHPDYHREEKVAEDPAVAPATDAPSQKAS